MAEPKEETETGLVSERKSFLDQCATMWKLIDAEREHQHIDKEDAAVRCGFARATWYNKRHNPEKLKLWELANMADLLGFSFRFPVYRSGKSDSRSTVDHVEQRGGLTLSDAMATIGLYLDGLSLEQQGDVARAVQKYCEMRGFHRPSGKGSHPAARRK